MPININDTTKYKNDVQISYNYNSIPIYINQFKNTIKSDGFIKIPYASNGTDPNVIIVDDNKTLQYKTTDLYIIKSQNLVDISYSAELVVQHKSITNDNTLFTCFLLDSSNSFDEKTNIDELVNDSLNNGKNSPPNKTLSLQNVTTNTEKTIYFKPDSNNTVIILTKPFIIQTVFDSSLNNLVPPLFNTSPTDYKIIEPIVEKFSTIEGFTKNMYCQPVDMTDPSGEIVAGANLSIPIDGKYSPNNATNNIIRTAINFMSFVLVLGLSYVMIPVIYNDYIIGLINIGDAQLKLTRIRSIDIYTTVVFIFCIFGLISQGIESNNSARTVLGFFMGLFFIISFVIIQSKKISPEWFKSVGLQIEEEKITSLYTGITVSEDFFKFMYENFMLLFSFQNFMLLLFIYSLILSFLAILGGTKKNGFLTSGNSHLYILLLSVYITIAIDTVSKRKS